MKINKFPLIKLCFLAILTTWFASCNSDSNGGKKDESFQDEIRYKKTLLVIGDDRSGSTSDIRKLTEEDYKTLFSAVNEQGGGTVAVCLIGNPLPQSREPYILTLDNQQNIQQYDPRNTQLTLTEKSRIKLSNDKIIADNDKVLASNENKITKFIVENILTNIIHYKPSGIDHTDLDDAINRIDVLLHEPQFNDYEQLLVVFVSDGHHQPGKGNRPITQTLEMDRANVLLVGWETPDTCFRVQKIEKFSSKDGMINLIRNLK